MTVTSIFGVEVQTSASVTYPGSVEVVNQSASPQGAGWSVAGVQRVFAPDATGPAARTESESLP